MLIETPTVIDGIQAYGGLAIGNVPIWKLDAASEAALDTWIGVCTDFQREIGVV